MDIKIKIDELKKLINIYNIEYYVKDTPFILDVEYDKLFHELIELEKNNPEFITPDSPTQRVGSKPLEQFKTIEHLEPMISISNTYNDNELIEFNKRIQKSISNPEYIVDHKVDGIAVTVIYEYGVIKRALTRGDGKFGDDITQNVKTIKNLPLSINCRNIELLEVRGEVYIDNNDFEKLNENRRKNNLDCFANPRNAASGTLKLLDSREVAKRPLKVVFHSLGSVKHTEKLWDCHSNAIDILKSFGLPVIQYKKFIDFKNVINYIKEWDLQRNNLPYNTDGVVIKIDNLKHREILGSTSHSPRWTVAFKYQAERAETILNNIVFQVGRTGIVTPVAEFEPIFLDGSTIKRATLHNEDEIKKKDIRIGDTIIVQKAGDIIPQIVSVVLEKRKENSKPFEFIKYCPCCSESLIKIKDQVAYRCTNSLCKDQIKLKILHFASKAAMDIDNLGISTVKLLVDKKLVGNIVDLYKLNVDDITILSRMGDTSAHNLLNGIKISKIREPYRLLYAMGIPNIGVRTAELLFNEIDNILDLKNFSIEQFESINEIGNETAIQLYNWFHEENNINILNDLKELGLKFEKDKKGINNMQKLSNLNFVITGTLSLKRSEIENMIKENGGKVSSSISKNINYLIVGEDPGSKLEKAKKLNIKVINEDEFRKMLI